MQLPTQLDFLHFNSFILVSLFAQFLSQYLPLYEGKAWTTLTPIDKPSSLIFTLNHVICTWKSLGFLYIYFLGATTVLNLVVIIQRVYVKRYWSDNTWSTDGQAHRLTDWWKSIILFAFAQFKLKCFQNNVDHTARIKYYFVHVLINTLEEKNEYLKLKNKNL